MKIMKWWKSRGKSKPDGLPNTFNREQIEKAYALGYSDGTKNGLSIARRQAVNSLREILQQQNRQQ